MLEAKKTLLTVFSTFSEFVIFSWQLAAEHGAG